MSTRQSPFARHWMIPLGKNTVFTVNPWVTIIFIIVLSIMLRLGLWQLDRRNVKLTYNQEVTSFLATHNAPLAYSNALSAFKDKGRQASDVSTTITGQFSEHTPVIYHDNRVHNMQAGLHALALFEPENQSLPPVLINLGWLPWPVTGRPNLPSLSLPDGTVTLQGKLFAPNPETWTLEHIPPRPEARSWLIQKLDLSIIAKQIAPNLAPFTLRLQPETELSIPVDLAMPPHTETAQQVYPIRAFKATTDWAMTPDKHMGYAVQWFVMSLVLTGIYLGVNLKRRNTTLAPT